MAFHSFSIEALLQERHKPCCLLLDRTLKANFGHWSPFRRTFTAITSKKPTFCVAGNLRLWLKGCGPHDRKSTESSNLPLLPPSHSAPHLYLSDFRWCKFV